MFSEYASRFLQQSNARLSFTAQDPSSSASAAAAAARSNTASPHPLDRRRSSSRTYVQRPTHPGMPNPYAARNPAASQSRFPFAARLPGRARAAPDHAPLFHAEQEDFAEEDEEGEREREVQDFYALQRSRRRFGPALMGGSGELDEEEEEEEEDGEEEGEEEGEVRGQRHDRNDGARRGRLPASRGFFAYRDQSVPESEASAPSSKGKGRLVDVNLASTINEEPPESLANISASELDPDEPPAPFQTFRTSTTAKGDPRQSSFLPIETDSEANLLHPHPPSPDRESVPPTVILPTQEPPRHDAFWATLFEISLFAMFASFTLIYFHTSTPKTPLGDTIYTALRGSTSLLLWDTTLAIIVALIWLALLRHHVRNLVYLILLAVPIILFAFSLYPLIASFRGTYHGSSMQDKAMRVLALIPLALAALWSWSIIVHRHSLARSIRILEFATKILSASPYLIALGFATLGTVVSFTWIWMLMFKRIFLSGHFADDASAAAPKRWILAANSWWLGAAFILQYLWTLAVIAGIQRATSAATVSQWYFHRLAVPQPSSRDVVRASLQHAVGALLGTVCLSTFLSVLVRLPLVVLPARVGGLLNMCAYCLIPTPLAMLTNPLTLTYAAVHSQPLGISARGLSQLSFVSATNPSNTLVASGPARHFSPGGGDSAARSALVPYRLAKLLLQATKWIMAAALGFGGWVRTARDLRISPTSSSSGSDAGAASVRGSLYAYVVGLIAATIGFAVLGAVENVVGAVLDAAVVCWASETGGGRHGREARFCREAGELFGGDADGVVGEGVGLR